jgi:pyruvate-formate lyase-activating enzyme
MLVDLARFASLAEIEVGADTALVADALNWLNLAAVAGHSNMDLRGLVGGSLS